MQYNNELFNLLTHSINFNGLVDLCSPSFHMHNSTLPLRHIMEHFWCYITEDIPHSIT